MNTHIDTHFQKKIITIHPGEYFSSFDDLYIATILGSCISIALFDPQIKLGGLNHFMLPTTWRENISPEEQGRFGNYAVELLLNDLYSKGAKKKNLKAKIFGGGNVLDTGTSSSNMTGINNINFAVTFLETERIPIVANDTGGIFPRKIYFHPQTAKVYLKRIQKTGMSLEQIKQQEEAYQEKLKKSQEKVGDITWF